MAKKVGSVYAEIRARLDKFERDLKKAQGQTLSATNRIQRSLNRINFDRAARSLAQFVGAYAGAQGIGSLIRMGADYEQSIFSMSQTFQGETDAMIATARRMSEQFNNYYNFNDIAYAFTKTADSMERYGITGEKYIELVRRAADVGAAKNLELKESIDRIESAMRGEAEASEYLGLTLNDTYMKTIAFDGALSGTWETMSDLEKAQYRFNELMLQSQKYTGAAEAATNTFSGAIKALGNAIEDRLNKTLLASNSVITRLIVKLREMWDMPQKLTRLEGLKQQQDELIKRQETLNAAIREMGRSKTPGKQQYLDRLFQKLGLVQDKLAIVSQEMRRLRDTAASVDESIDPGDPAKTKTPTRFREGGYLSTHEKWKLSEKQSRESFDRMKSHVSDYAKHVDDNYQRIDDRVRSVTANMTDAITQAVETGKTSFKDFARSVISDLLRIQTRMALMGLASQVIGAFTPSYAPAHVGAGGTTAFKMQHGGYLGEGVVGIGKRSGRSYEFHPNEYVMPSDKMGGGGVVINNYSGLPAMVEERPDVNGIKRTFVEIGNDILRGGPTDKAIRMRYGLQPAGNLT